MGVTTTDTKRPNIECETDCPCQETWELLAAVGCDAERTIARLLRPCPWTEAATQYSVACGVRYHNDTLEHALRDLIADCVASGHDTMLSLPHARRVLTGSDGMGGDV